MGKQVKKQVKIEFDVPKELVKELGLEKTTEICNLLLKTHAKVLRLVKEAVPKK